MVLRLAGGRTIGAPRETVWDALHDARCLQLCVPGCLSLDRVADTRFAISVLVPIGPVSLPFQGTIDIAQSERPCRLLLRGRGKGGLAGLAAGALHIALEEVAGGTRLAYAIDAEPIGPLAMLGTVLLAGVARDLVQSFGTTLAAHIDGSRAADWCAQSTMSTVV